MLDWLAARLGPARGGHLGDPRRPAALHLRAADELGGARPRASGWPPHGRPGPSSAGPPAGPDLRPGQRPGAGTPTRRAFVQHYHTDVLDSVAAAHADGRVHRARGPDVDRPRSRRWTPSWSPTAWSTATTPPPRRTVSRLGGHVLALHVRLRGRARPGGTGRRGAATFAKMLTYANHLGLYSEEIALTGEQIGNFPQAFGPGAVAPSIAASEEERGESTSGINAASAAAPPRPPVRRARSDHRKRT